MKRPILSILGMLMIFALISSMAPGENNAGRETLFFQANEAYENGLFEEAAKRYEELIRTGPVGGAVFYNLGNCYIRLGRLGKAVLNYERAKRIMPRDPDLNFNLQYAKNQRVDKTKEQTNPLDMVFFWLGSVTLKESAGVFAVFNLLLWGLLILRIWRRSEWSFYALIVTVGCWALFGCAFAWEWKTSVHDARAIVIAQEAEVRAGPHSGDTVLFKLHEGTTVFQERTEENWRLIRLTKEKRGWMESDKVTPILFDR